MSGVLQRLVERAAGTEMPGLRPRLPGLFESGTGDAGLVEVAGEAAAPQAEGSRSAMPLPVPPQVLPTIPPEHAAPPPRPAPLLPAAETATRSTIAAPSPEPLPFAAEPAPASSARHPVEARVAEPDSPLAPLVERTRPAPPPLLPAEPPERLVRIIRTRLTESLPPAPRPAGTAIAAPAEPEITIQIGRLDIRSETPAPRAAPRPSPQPSLPSLADYLRGGRR